MAAGCDYLALKPVGASGGSTYLAYLAAALLRANHTGGALCDVVRNHWRRDKRMGVGHNIAGSY